MISLSNLKFDGVQFVLPSGERIHSWQDLRLAVSGIQIDTPEAKKHTIEDVFGIDSALDFTDDFGPVRFNNRNVIITFDCFDDSWEKWFSVYGHQIYDNLHGKQIEAIFDDDKDYYWSGRAAVDWNKEHNLLSAVSVTIDAYPYKRTCTPYIYKTSVEDGTTSTITLVNDAMPSSPTITSESDCTVTFNNSSYNLLAGANTAEFELLEGDNSLEITGGGAITISWAGGRLM